MLVMNYKRNWKHILANNLLSPPPTYNGLYTKFMEHLLWCLSVTNLLYGQYQPLKVICHSSKISNSLGSIPGFHTSSYHTCIVSNIPHYQCTVYSAYIILINFPAPYIWPRTLIFICTKMWTITTHINEIYIYI